MARRSLTIDSNNVWYRKYVLANKTLHRPDMRLTEAFKEYPVKKRPKQSSVTSRLDDLTRKVVKARDHYCVTCGTSEGLEVSHYIGRAKFGLRWDLRNCNMQCHACHMAYHSGSPDYMRYLIGQYGETILDELYAQQQAWVERGGVTGQEKKRIEQYLKKELDKWQD